MRTQFSIAHYKKGSSLCARFENSTGCVCQIELSSECFLVLENSLKSHLNAHTGIDNRKFYFYYKYPIPDLEYPIPELESIFDS